MNMRILFINANSRQELNEKIPSWAKYHAEGFGGYYVFESYPALVRFKKIFSSRLKSN